MSGTRRTMRGAVLRICAAAVLSAAGALAPAAQETGITEDASVFLGDYVSREWSASDGLPGNNITDMLQSRSGYMYFGTYTGLVRFDGVDFLTINRSLDSKYSFVSARTVFEDSKGFLWVGSNDEGAYRLGGDGSVLKINHSSGLPNNSVRAFAEDQGGNIWIGTAAGVAFYTPEGALVIPEGLEQDNAQNLLVQCLYCDTAGRIWLTSHKPGMTFVYSSGSFSRFKGFQSMPDATVDCIIQDAAGVFWFGLAPNYAIRMDGKTEKLYNLSYAKQNSTIVNDIFQDSSGTIWFAMDRGLAIMREGRLCYYEESQGLIDNNVNRVLEDREGNIWICTDRGGVEKLTLSKFRTVSTPSTINAIAEDRERGLVWLGSDDGLLCYSYSDNSFHTNELTESAQNCRIRHVAFTRDGRLLVSTYGPQGQLCLTFTGGEDADSLTGYATQWTDKDGLGNNKSRVALEASNGDLYIGTTSGLSIVDHDSGRISRTIRLADGLPNEFIMALFEDSDGTIWGGTDGGGVFLLKDGEVARLYSTEDGLAGNVIFKIARMSDGAIWICTGTGITRMTGQGMFNFDPTVGLGDDGVFQMMTDYTDTAWFTSNGGIFSASFSQMKDLAEGRIPHMDSRIYGRSDGLRSGGVTSTSLSMQDREGRIWFTLIDGFTVYDPVKVINKTEPLVQIQDVSIDNEQVDAHGQIVVIPPEGKRLHIAFTGLSFVSPEQMQFRYRLEGFEDEYSPWSATRDVSFTNLKPGSYRFYVQAANSDGLPSDISQPLVVIKKPFFWQRWWFWFHIILATVAIVAFLIWNRYRKMKRYQKELEQEVAKQTKELRKQAKALAQSNKDLEHAKDKVEELLLNILPRPIARELSERPGSLIAKQYPAACVLFADLVGFTKMSDRMAAGDVVNVLNSLFTKFDLRANACGVEKIKTIGDAYMAATGLTEDARNDGVAQMLKMAQGMMDDVKKFNEEKGLRLQVRIGINCGNLVAGVIGKTKFGYDIWGDTVNVASRMESTGTPGCIHVTEAVWERSHEDFAYTGPVEIEVKGKGLMKTYLLGDVDAAADSSPAAAEAAAANGAADGETPEGYAPITLEEIALARGAPKQAAGSRASKAEPDGGAPEAAADGADRPVVRTGRGLLATCIERNKEAEKTTERKN